MVRGKDAYGDLRNESGVHRVQRVPVTESQGRIHTSAATVAVLPEAEEVDVEIRDAVPWSRPALGGSSVFQAVPALNQYWHPWLLGGRAHGEARVGDETWTLDGWSVYGEKNWGKGGFPDEAIEPMQRLGMVYFAIVGGAAALETTQIEEIEEVAWEELMPECLWKFRVKDFGPLTVGIDAHGNSLYHDVQAQAQEKLKELYARL